MKPVEILICLLLLVGGAFFASFKREVPALVVAQTQNQTSAISESVSKDEPLRLPLVEPRIVVKKGERKLMLYSKDKLLRTYKIGLGFDPTGDKQKEGDGRTPEGEFYIFTKNPNSQYYLSLGVSYPSTDDAERGLRERLITKKQRDQIARAIRRKGVPLQRTALGGEIYIHGNGSSRDWTLGCVALDDADMKELFDAVPQGAKVVIEP